MKVMLLFVVSESIFTLQHKDRWNTFSELECTLDSCGVCSCNKTWYFHIQ